MLNPVKRLNLVKSEPLPTNDISRVVRRAVFAFCILLHAVPCTQPIKQFPARVFGNAKVQRLAVLIYCHISGFHFHSLPV